MSLKSRGSIILAATLFATAAAWASLSIGWADPPAGGQGPGVTSAEVNQQIAAARSATAKYHDLDTALEDGFVDTGLPCIEGQGFHYVKLARVGSLDIEKPQVLVYAPDNRLVALEWIIPASLVDEAPTLFGETFHGPNDGGLFFLHVWAWQGNPDGMFADTHPQIHCD